MPLKGLTILAVDDNEAHNYALSRTLETAGCKVLRAYTGTKALELASAKPDAIVLDINLPDLNGFEVCRRIRSYPVTAGIPIIFITAAHFDPNAKAMAENVGAKALLFYPVEAEQLVMVIKGQIASRAEKA